MKNSNVFFYYILHFQPFFTENFEHFPQPLKAVPSKMLWKSILKIWRKVTGEHPCWSVISVNLQSHFIEITLQHSCFTVNMLHILKASSYKVNYKVSQICYVTVGRGSKVIDCYRPLQRGIGALKTYLALRNGWTFPYIFSSSSICKSVNGMFMVFIAPYRKANLFLEWV